MKKNKNSKVKKTGEDKLKTLKEAHKQFLALEKEKEFATLV